MPEPSEPGLFAPGQSELGLFAPGASNLGPAPAAAEKSGFSVGGIVVVVVGVLAVCGFGGIAASSMVSTALDPRPAPDGMIEQLCGEPGRDAGVDDLCPAPEAGAEAEEPAAQADLPVATLPPGPELANAYLDRYQHLLTSERPATRIEAVHQDSFAGDRVTALNRKVHECDALTGITITPGQVRTVETNAKHTVLSVRVVERAPSCVTGAKAAPGAVVQGTTDLKLTFVKAMMSDSRNVWQLTELHATPVQPDPLSSAPADQLGNAVVRADDKTLFAPAAT